MARDIGDDIEVRIIMRMKLSNMDPDAHMYVFQARHLDLPDETPSIGVGIDIDPDDPEAESLTGVMSLQEAAMLAHGINHGIQEIIGLYAEGQSDEFVMSTLSHKGGPRVEMDEEEE